MIEKIIPGDSQEELIKASGQMIQVYESGRHIKSAASNMFGRKDLEKFAPPKGKFLSHMITMGSSELYGANRNCWFAGEPVRTPYGFRPIETLTEGELVLTAGGAYQPITRLFQREYEGVSVSVKAQGLALPFTCTAEHPIKRLAKEHVRPEKLYRREGSRKNRKRPGTAFSDAVFAEAAVEKVEFVAAETLRPGDWVCVPITEVYEASEEIFETDAWAYGLFLADGCNYKEYREISSQGEAKGSVFTLGSGDDAGVIPRLLNIIEAHDNRTAVLCSYTSEKGLRIQWCNQAFARSCQRLFGAGACTKTLAAAVFGQCEDWKLRLLAGWFDGDGCLISSGKEKYQGTLTCSTASLDLACATQRLLASVGIPSSVSRNTNKHAQGCFGKTDLTIYSISVGPAYSNLILQHSARMLPHTRQINTIQSQRVTGGQLWFRVKKVTQAEVVDICYNIEVKEEHTYVTTVAGHNCDLWGHEQLLKKHATFVTHGHNYREHKNSDPKYAVGEIKAEAYDPVKQRGEVLMWTDIDKAASEFEKARKGEEQHGSMAATVDHDVCTCCNFISKTASQRCDHIRLEPGKYFPKFQKYAHMDNIDPTFKDYSWVRRPADRIAHTLNYLMPQDKAASVTRELRGDELALIYGAAHPALGTLRQIAEFDQPHLDHPGKQAAATALLPRAFEGEWDAELLEKMAYHAYPGKVMRSAIDRQMVMPLASFQAFVSGQSLCQAQVNPTVKEASAKMASIRIMVINKLDEDPGFGQAFSEAGSQFEPMNCGCEDIVDQFMDSARDQFSLRYEALAKRAALNEQSLIKLAAPAVIEVSPDAFALGALYQAYLTKVAEHMEDDWIISGQLSALR